MSFWAISTQSSEKLSRLHLKEGLWPTLLRSESFKSEIILEFADSNEPGVIPVIASYLFARDPKVRLAARVTTHRLLQLVPLGRMFELDERMRRVYSEDWRGVHPENLDFLPDVEHSGSLLGLTSFHPNGRVREAALKILYSSGWEGALTYFLIRLNDWVVPVRQYAFTAAQSRLDPKYVSFWLKILPILLRLEFQSRANHTSFIESVAALFQRPECYTFLELGLNSKDAKTRRMCLRFALGCEPNARNHFLQLAFKNKDPIIRSSACKQLLADSNAEDLMPLIHKLLADSSVIVRREAIQALINRQFEAATPILKNILFDRNAWMREIARYYLKKSDVVDVREVYRNALNSESDHIISAAIIGLGETGQLDDVSLIRPFLKVKSSNVRCSTCIAISKLSKDECINDFVDALGDASPRVSRAALRALITRSRRANHSTLIELLNSSELPHVRRNVLKLVQGMGKWECLPLLFKFCSDLDESVANMAREYLHSWLINYNRSFAEPNKQQMQICKSSLDANISFIGNPLVNSLQLVFDEWVKRLAETSRNI